MDAELVYLSMLGELVQPLEGIPNAFAAGEPCQMLYQQIYEAKCRLCDRLGVDEDADLECILDCFSEINRELCLRMYHLGLEHADMQKKL